MRIECYDLHGQIFTHVDNVTGANTIYAATALRQHCDRETLPIVFVPIDPAWAREMVRLRGLEEHRLLRACQTKRWLPLLFAHQSDGTQLLIDGSHSYVARALLGFPWSIAYIVPQEIWCYYTVEGLPSETEDAVINSWSGIL